MKFVVKPGERWVEGYCLGCKTQCQNDCQKQCLDRKV